MNKPHETESQAAALEIANSERAKEEDAIIEARERKMVEVGLELEPIAASDDDQEEN